MLGNRTLLLVALLATNMGACVNLATWPTCENGLVSSTCRCGTVIAGAQYCCDEALQASPCDIEDLNLCPQGPITESCLCGDTAASSGYCCAGTLQDSECDMEDPLPCMEGSMTESCLCGDTVASAGYCCAGVLKASACEGDADEVGWTSFIASADTRVIYVSSGEGDDSNDGDSSTRPKRTIAAGVALLRDGYPDWLLLKRGDVWNEGLGRWRLGGRSPSEPMLVGTYGDAPERPLLQTGARSGMNVFGGVGAPESVSFLAVVGLHFWAHTRDPDSDAYQGPEGGCGVAWLRGSQWMLFEDNVFESYAGNINIHPYDGFPIETVLIRRNLLLDAYNTNAHSQGSYIAGISTRLLIEENIFDHNGWNESVSGAHHTMYNHNMYLQSDNTAVVEVIGNIAARGASHGLQLRSGGSAVNNLFVGNVIAAFVAGDSCEGRALRQQMNYNVVLHGSERTLDGGAQNAWGLEIMRGEHCQERQFIGNVVAFAPNGIRAFDYPDYSFEGADNVAYSWGGTSDVGPFPHPERDLGTYNASLGRAPSVDAFLAELRLQRKGRWLDAYTAAAVNTYIRAGFGVPEPSF